MARTLSGKSKPKKTKAKKSKPKKTEAEKYEKKRKRMRRDAEAIVNNWPPRAAQIYRKQAAHLVRLANQNKLTKKDIKKANPLALLLLFRQAGYQLPPVQWRQYWQTGLIGGTLLGAAALGLTARAGRGRRESLTLLQKLAIVGGASLVGFTGGAVYEMPVWHKTSKKVVRAWEKIKEIDPPLASDRIVKLVEEAYGPEHTTLIPALSAIATNLW